MISPKAVQLKNVWEPLRLHRTRDARRAALDALQYRAQRGAGSVAAKEISDHVSQR